MRSTRRVIYTEARVCFTKMVTECSRSTEVFGAPPSDPRSVRGRPVNAPPCPKSTVAESNRSGQSGPDARRGARRGPEREDKSAQRFDGCVRRRGCGCLPSISGLEVAASRPVTSNWAPRSHFPLSLSFPILPVRKLDKHAVGGPNTELAVSERPAFVLHQVVVVVVGGGSNGHLNSISFQEE